MKLLELLLLAVAIATVTAKHKKAWQKVDVVKMNRERFQTFYKSEVPACAKGAGFYRDPQDCHQYIRCVDAFGSGKQFKIYPGRCEPGLVFDENVSACNWPELAAPCSNSPERFQDSNPIRQEQAADDNAVSEESDWNKPYPVQQQQQQEGKEPQRSDVYETQQQEIPVVQEIQIAAQEPVYQDKIEQVFVETQEPSEEQVQEQVYQVKVQAPETQDQVFQQNIQVPEIEQQNFENVKAVEQPAQEQQIKQMEQQQIIYKEPSENDQINSGLRPEVPSSGFQQVIQQESQRFQVPQHDKFSHQESQVEWWVPEEKPQHNPPEIAQQVQSSNFNQQPMFCSQEGFYRHPENCSQFIRCVEIGRAAYAVHFFECPKQLVFDEKDSSCIVSDIHSCRSSTRTKRQASSTNLKCKGEGFFRHPEDCRAFYRCVKSATGSYETHQFSCPANLVFDEEYTTCNWPEKAPPCDSRQQDYKPTRKPIKPVETEKPRSQYKPPSRSTSGGSWSTAKPSNDFIDKSLTQETYRKRISTSKPKSTTQSYETGAKCRSPGFFQNDNDCTKFFKCVKKGNSFIRYELSCPQNFAYDDMSKRCIAQRYVASCNRNKPPYPPRQDDEETTASPEATSAKSSNSQSGDDDIVCEKEGYFRHPQDCNKFYRCVDFNGNGEEFVRYDFNCPEGLVFDEANSVCNWPDQSTPCETRGSGGQGPGGDGGSDGTDDSGTGGKEEDGGRGSDSEESSSSTTSTQSSTAPSESTSSAPENESEQGESNKDSDVSKSDGTCTKEGFYRNPEDCNKFYRCVDFDGEGKEFVRYDFSCPEGLVFDEANSVCNWPADSEPCDTRSSGGNEGGNERDGTDTSTSGSPERGGEPTEDSSQSQQTTPSSSESTPERNPSSESTTENSQSSSTSSNEEAGGTRRGGSGECTEEGFFRDPEDCNKFYRCVDQNSNGQFVKYDFTCPEGLVFDEANSVCNWPDQSAPCDGGSPGRGESSTSGPGGDGSESSEGTTSSTQKPRDESSEGTTESSTSTTTQRSTSTTTQRSQSTDNEDSSRSTTQKSTSESGGNEGTSDASESETGGNQGECTKEGFYRNPEDCNKFYRCVDFNGDGQQFVRYDFECPEGLVFDEVNSVCNWPDQSAPCETRGSAPGNETTDSDSGSSQTESSSQSTQSSTEQSTQSSTQQPTEGSTQRGGEQSTSDSSTTGDSSECTQPGFYRCKDDCNKFYRCVEEDGRLVRYDFKCPDGLIFDDKNKKCDWPSSELTCDSDSSSSTTSSYESSTTAATQTSTTRSETSSSASTTKECTKEGFFRDPDDCRKYYRCIDEGDGTFTREDYSCAEDEVFDEEMRYCNRKDLAPPCDDSQTTSSQSQTTSSGSQSTTERSPTSTQSSTKSGSNSECTQPGFFRCPEDCTKFYRCVDEDGKLVRYDFTCPEGLIFDEKNEKCNWPSSEITCDSSSSSTTESSTSASQTSGATAQESSSSTTSGSTSSDGCKEEGFFRNPEDCSKYYRCIDEGDGTLTREDFACAEDEVFDEEMRYCNRKDLAPPCDETSSTTESSRSSTSQSSTKQESETSTSSSGTTSGSSTSGECTEEGFHRDPNDCSKFYRCVDFQGDGKSFTRYDFDCPEGLVFDESNDVCNWPSSVPSCESSGESEGSRGSGSTTEGSSAATSQTSDSSTSSASQTEQTTSASRDNDRTTSGEQSTSESTTASTSSESGTTSSGGSTSSTSSSRGSGSSDNIECTEEGFFRHPDDCSKFYRCVDFAGTGESFVRYDFECAEGTVFDEVNKVCNWPNMSPPCESGSRSSSKNNESESTSSDDNRSTTSSGTSESSTERSGTSSQSDSSTTPQDQTTRSSASSTSSSSDEFQCQEEGFFKHPTDCRKYYECKRDEETGELVKIDCECPEGQVWDNDGWYCNAEELSPPCDSGSTFKCKEEGFFRDPEDCTKYYQCNRTGPGENDFTSERHQCDDGLVFDEEGRYCNAPELSKPCDESSSTSSGTTSSESPNRGATDDGTSSGQGECTREGFFRNPEDCTKYYLCSSNEETGGFDRTDYSCPDGRIFDEGSNYCNEPELSEEPCESNGQSTTSRQSGTDSSTSGGATESSTSSGVRRSGGNPECTQEGFFRHPDDCAKFYRCVDFSGSGESFVRYDFDCPEGTHFDEVNSVCNWPTMTPACESVAIA